MVVVSDGIINSQVDADKRIICQGKRATIVGGRLRALEEINAKTLGSPTSGTETICEVGIDPKSKNQLEILAGKREGLEKKLEEVQRNLQTLVNIKKQQKSLPENKETQMRELMEERQRMMEELIKNKNESGKIQEFLNSLKVRGKVSASNKIYAGVKVIIKDSAMDVRSEYKSSTFIQEGGLIRVIPYEAPDDEAKKAPEGYAAD
jgi:uncharacterized protein (DUF342 family)